MNITTLVQQISRYTTMLVNARNFVYSENKLWFDISIEGKRGSFKIEISMEHDTYTIKLLQLKKKTLEVVTLATREMVFVEKLNSTIQNFVIEGW